MAAAIAALETRLGTLSLRIPKLRQGSYFPPFLEPRKTAEKALVTVIQEAWIGELGQTAQRTESSNRSPEPRRDRAPFSTAGFRPMIPCPSLFATRRMAAVDATAPFRDRTIQPVDGDPALR